MRLHRLILTIIVFLISVNAAEVTGQGFLKTNDGRVVTCAGEIVYLDINGTQVILSNTMFPSSIALYEAQLRGAKLDKNNKKIIELEEKVQLWKEKLATKKDLLKKFSKEGKILTSMCDAQGNFVFNNVPKGSFYIGTTVKWRVGHRKQGGFIMKSVHIKKEDDKIRVLITK